MIDLHTHSTFSDGTLTPTEIVRLAKKINLYAVALTDHNTLAGLDEFVEAGKKYGIEAICGIEISTAHNGKDYHILGLLLDGCDLSELKFHLENAFKKKIEGNKRLVKALNADGIDISYDEIVKDFGSEYFNRVLIANALIKHGYTQSVDEAFSKYLSKKCGYYTPPERLDTLEVIDLIKRLGAVPVFAHPMENDFDEIDSFLPIAKKHGLAGMEVMHSSYSKTQEEQARLLAGKYGLIECGGSDFHGANKPNVMLGTGVNSNVNVDDDVIAQLKNFKEKN